VEFELLLGLLLVSGILPRLTWASSLVCFGGFALVSLYKALSGDASCGCFGRVPVKPWYTFALDTASVLALFHWRPAEYANGAEPRARGLRPLLRITAVWLTLGAAIGLPAVMARQSAPGDLGEVSAVGVGYASA
jgi:hypothetical protein